MVTLSHAERSAVRIGAFLDCFESSLSRLLPVTVARRVTTSLMFFCWKPCFLRNNLVQLLLFNAVPVGVVKGTIFFNGLMNFA